MGKRVLALLLCFIMLAAFVPTQASADPANGNDPQLLWRWGKWDQDSRTYVSDPTQPFHSEVLKESPGYGTILEFFYDDRSDSDPVPIPCSALSFQGSGYSVSPQGDLAFINFTDFGSVEVSYLDASMTIDITLPWIGFYSAPQATKANYRSRWDYNGTNNDIYVMYDPNSGWGFSSVASVLDMNGSSFIYEIAPDASYIKLTLTEPDINELNFRLIRDDGTEVIRLNISIIRPQLLWRWGKWDQASQTWVSDPSQPLRSGNPTWAPGNSVVLEFFYDNFSGDPVAVPYSLLSFEGSFFTPEPEGDFVRLSITGFGEGKVVYNDATLFIKSALPWLGFYAAPQATEANYRYQWDYDGTNNNFYLMYRPGSGQDFSNVASVQDENNTGFTYEIAPDKSYVKFTLTEPNNTNLIYQLLDTAGNEIARQGIWINDQRPQLVWRMAEWDQTTQSYVHSVNQSLADWTIEEVPGDVPVFEFYYDDRNGNLSFVPYSDLSIQGNCFTYEPEGDFVRLRFTGFGEGKIVYNGVTRNIQSALPWMGFYAAPQATEANFRSQWDYDGTNNDIYLMYRPGSGRDFSNVASIEDVNNIGFSYEIAPDKSYIKFTLADPQNTYLSCKLIGTGGNQITWQGIRINALSPGLVYCWPQWDSVNHQWIPHTDPTTVYLWKSAIQGSPNNGDVWEFFWRDASDNLTRLHTSDLSVTGSCIRLQDQGDIVQLFFEAFGTGSISYNGSTIPVNVGLPDAGFYSAPQVSEANYVASYDWYEGEAQTLYYTTATPGDLVIDTVNSNNSNITAAVEPGGKFIRIEPVQGVTGTFRAQIGFSGTDPHYTNPITGQLDVTFHVPQPQLYCIPVLEPAEDYIYDGMYDGMGRPEGESLIIRPYTRINGQMQVYTGDLTPVDPGIVTLRLLDPDEHYWQVTFVGQGQTWLKGTENGTDYYIGIHPGGPNNTRPGERMLFEVVIPPHSDYRLDGGQFTGFSVMRDESGLFQFVDELNNPVTTGLTYDASGFTVEAVPNSDLDGVFKITGKRIGDYSITANGRICDVFVFGWSRQLTEVPAVSPDCTTGGTLRHWKDENGLLYLLPQYPYVSGQVMTRAMMAQFLCTACGWLETGLNNPYTDVDSSMAEYDAILTLTKYGIVAGTGNGEFNPSAPVTRAEAAVMMTRCTLWGSTMAPQLDPAPDVPYTHWAAMYIQFCLENGFLTVDAAGNFNPNSQLSFEEIGLADLICWTWNRQVTQADVADPSTGHSLTHVAAVAATTAAPGNREYWTCSACGKYFSDAQGVNEITRESTVIPRLTPAVPIDTDITGGTAAETTSTTTNVDGSKTTTVTSADGTKTETTEYTDGSSVETVTNTDGSTKETVTDAEGNVKETETAADGSKEVISTAADGSTAAMKIDAEGKVTEASAEVSAQAIKEAEEAGEAVTLDVELTAEKEAEDAALLTIAIPEEAGTVTVNIPVTDVTNTSVVVLVHEDGTEEILPKTKLTEDGLSIALEGNVSVKIVENEKTYTDTADLAEEEQTAVSYVTARGLYEGVGNDEFAPEVSMDRFMFATVLHRLESKPEAETVSGFADVAEDEWYSEGVAWAVEKGIVVGYSEDEFGGTDPVTREQIALMLWRYFGKPEVTETVETSAHDWAAEAMSWAVSNGLFAADTDAAGEASRVDVAVVLQRFIEML